MLFSQKELLVLPVFEVPVTNCRLSETDTRRLLDIPTESGSIVCRLERREIRRETDIHIFSLEVSDKKHYDKQATQKTTTFRQVRTSNFYTWVVRQFPCQNFWLQNHPQIQWFGGITDSSVGQQRQEARNTDKKRSSSSG